MNLNYKILGHNLQTKIYSIQEIIFLNHPKEDLEAGYVPWRLVGGRWRKAKKSGEHWCSAGNFIIPPPASQGGGEKAGKSTENCTLKPELANGTEQRVGEYTFILYFHYTDKHFYQVNHLPTEFLLGKMMTSRILGVG